MPLAIAFWVLMLLWLVFGVWSSWPNLRSGGPNLLLFILLLIIGWKLFGPPLHS